jgi:hypothetical protein
MLLEILLKKYKEEKLFYSYIDKDELFVKGKLNIVYGEKAAGKTTSVLKYLNSCNIKPFYIDYDSNEINYNVYRFVGCDNLIKDIIEFSSVDDVIVIDHLDGLSNGRYMSEEDATKVLTVLSNIKATVILLAHATAFKSATKKQLSFRGNDKIANNALTVYRLQDNNLYIEKRRNKNNETIIDWMI